MDIGKALGDAAKGVLGTVAPMLATAVGGPLAGAAVGSLTHALGLEPSTAPEDVGKVIAAATPDQLLAIKKADADFAVQMKQLDLDASKLDYSDRADARAREVAVKDHTPAILAYTLAGGFFGLLAVMMFHQMPQGSETLLNVMLGALGSSFGMSVSYYFGSSNKPTSAVAPVGK